MRVAEFAGSRDEWDGFVRASPGWTHFHLYGWKDVIGDVFGHECPYLAATDTGGGLAAVLPLIRVKSRLFGHYLVSVPFVNYGGPLGSDEGIRSVTDAAVAMAGRDRVKLLELRSRTELPLDLAASHRKITVLMDIPDGANGLWEGFKAKLRSQIRRPQKAGIETRFGVEQVDGFYEVFARHMRDLGTPVQPKRWFHALAEAFGDDVWFGCSYLESKPVAGGCGFRWGTEFEMTWASSLRSVSRLSPNMQLYWAFMERAANEGLRVFNFGRCTPGGSTHRFKKQWGSRDVPLWWYQYATDGPAATPSPDDGAYSWGPRVWRRLPVPLATAVGPHIVRNIP